MTHPVIVSYGSSTLRDSQSFILQWGELNMISRLGFIGIVIEDPARAPDINNILSRHGQIIAARMGIPRIHHNEAGISVITLIVQGTTDEIGALTGQLGNIAGVQVRSALSSK